VQAVDSAAVTSSEKRQQEKYDKTNKQNKKIYLCGDKTDFKIINGGN
jgi:hypothetical protein